MHAFASEWRLFSIAIITPSCSMPSIQFNLHSLIKSIWYINICVKNSSGCLFCETFTFILQFCDIFWKYSKEECRANNVTFIMNDSCMYRLSFSNIYKLVHSRSFHVRYLESLSGAKMKNLWARNLCILLVCFRTTTLNILVKWKFSLKNNVSRLILA